MKIRNRSVLLILILISGCVEPYEFVIKNKTPSLVVEGFISDVSYNETLKYPSDGRHFYIKLSYTNDVTNIRGAVVTGALINLISNTGDKWTYQEDSQGKYLLSDECFKASKDKSYKVEITLVNGDRYETTYQTLPQVKSNPQGGISFEETTKQVYERIAGEEKVTSVRGINVYVYVPVSNNDKPIYYKWDFEPTWVFEATLFPYINKTCWVTNQFYLADYALQEDFVGGYKKKLFFEKTDGNERFGWQFSLLVRQFIMNEEYYRFLTDIKIQADESLNDSPPYNLSSNISSLNNKNAVGYFAVVKESAKRWYFNGHDLSYRLENGYKRYCEDPLGDGGRVCVDCLGYSRGQPSLSKPVWWKDQ